MRILRGRANLLTPAAMIFADFEPAATLFCLFSEDEKRFRFRLDILKFVSLCGNF